MLQPARAVTVLTPVALLLPGCAAAGGHLSGTDISGGAGPGTSSGDSISIRGCDPSHPLIGGLTSDACGGAVLDAVTAALVRYDPITAAPRNDIAESITTADNRHFTVRIKRGYLFGDGTEVTAASFVNAWNWVAYGPNGAANSMLFRPIAGYEQLQSAGGRPPAATAMSGLRIIDDHTFTITTREPLANLPLRLGYTAFAPLPDSFFTDPQGYGRKPVTAGPYQVQEWSAGREIVLRRFDRYSGDYPGTAGTVIFRIYQDAATAYKDLLAGNLDITNDLPAASLLDDRFKADFPGRWEVKPIATNSLISFAPASVDASVADPRLRQALSMAIDRQTIAERIFGSARVAATGWVPPVVDGYSPGACGDYCRYDPARARRLLAEAGGYQGTLTLSYNADSDNAPWTTAVCHDITASLGIACVATPVTDLKTFRGMINRHEMRGTFRKGWQMDYPSIENFLAPLYATGASANDSQYSSAAFDARLRQAARASDRLAANALYQEAERLLPDGMPAIPLFDHRQVAVWSQRLDAARLTIKGTIDLSSVRLRGQPAATGASGAPAAQAARQPGDIR